jgi:hypothetical protein
LKRFLRGERHRGQELLSADPRDERFLATCVPQHVSDLDENTVSGCMPVSIVDALEIIEIDHQDAETPPALSRRDELRCRPIKAPSVTQPGQ